MSAPSKAVRRLPPDERRAQLQRAARVVLARVGVERFSLEEVAREAGVAATLPRHYFGSSEDLLVVAVLDVVERGTAPLVQREGDVRQRLREWISVLAANPWIHGIWMHSATVHPDVDAAITDRRRELVERGMGRAWARLSHAERTRGVAWIGACDAVVAEWIADGARDQARLIDALGDISRRLGLSIA